jgi:pimeloyl-ACP methyl ester carboxylesterase
LKASQKTPLLLIPALLCDQTLWQHQITALHDIAEIVIADTFSDDSLVAMAVRADQQMRDQFGSNTPYAVAGLSMGGYIALELWQIASQRISKIAMLNTSAAAESVEKTRQRQRLIATVKAHHRFHGMSDKQLREYIHVDQLQNQQLVDTIKQMTQRAGKENFIRQQQAIIARRDHSQLLHQITVPALIISGKNDVITPPELQKQMAEAIKDTTFVEISHCGHLSTLEKPENINIFLRNWLIIE